MSRRNIALASAGVILLLAAVLYSMGRVPWYECGYIKLWHGIVKSSENSQHFTDWYTFTHIIHGVGFYFVLWLFGRRLPAGVRFLLAVFLEAGWEILENTNFVIERYRKATIALDYFGDSIINSLGDLIAMMIGFWMAWQARVWVTVALVIGIEVLLLVMIRDNLTLNILMLLFPIEAIRMWQQAGATPGV